MKIVTLFLLLFIESFIGTQVQVQAQAETTKPKVLIYTDDGYPPYSFGTKETSFSDGIYIRIVNKIFEQMKDDYDISLLPFPWQRAIDATKTGSAFGVLPPYLNVKKRPWLSYSEPILTEQLVVFCNDKDGEWPDSYTGRGVAINYGFAFPKEIFDLIANKKMNLERPKDNKQSLKFLYQNKVSCYINDKNSIYYTLKSLNYDSNKVYIKAVITNVDGYLAYSHDKKLFPYGEAFIRKFNFLLLNMKKDGKIEEITKSFLK